VCTGASHHAPKLSSLLCLQIQQYTCACVRVYVGGGGRKLSPAFESKPAGRVTVSFFLAANTGHHTNRRSFLCGSVRPRIDDLPPFLKYLLHSTRGNFIFEKSLAPSRACARVCVWPTYVFFIWQLPYEKGSELAAPMYVYIFTC
jgi:hypothetical protein